MEAQSVFAFDFEATLPKVVCPRRGRIGFVKINSPCLVNVVECNLVDITCSRDLWSVGSFVCKRDGGDFVDSDSEVCLEAKESDD